MLFRVVPCVMTMLPYHKLVVHLWYKCRMYTEKHPWTYRPYLLGLGLAF